MSNKRAPQLRKRSDPTNKQNRSDAVMAQRGIAEDALDDFPTPPWATRALLTHVIQIYPGETALEPAAGRGYMSEVMKEFFKEVDSYDIEDYGYCPVMAGGFLEHPMFDGSLGPTHDWVITNPPFKLAEAFVKRALLVAKRGVAMLCRTVIIEGKHRYEYLYSVEKPAIIAQFVERVPMVEGRVDPKASTATGYCWVVWDKNRAAKGSYPSASNIVQTSLGWIPPCRKALEYPIDYVLPIKREK